MSEKPRFKVGQDIWFRYKQNRPAPVSVLGYGKKPKTYDICSLESVFILQDVEEQYLYATASAREMPNKLNRALFAGEFPHFPRNGALIT